MEQRDGGRERKKEGIEGGREEGIEEEECLHTEHVVWEITFLMTHNTVPPAPTPTPTIQGKESKVLGK